MAGSSSSDGAGAGAAPPFLSTPAPVRGFAFGQALRWVRQREGKGALRQTMELLWLSAVRKFQPDEYYLLGLFRRDLGPGGRRAFLSQKESTAFNRSLNAPELFARTSVVNDKILSGLVFEGVGLPVPRLVGHASTLCRFAGLGTLTTPEALVEFWRRPGVLPCFGKPVHGSRAIGAASLMAISGDGGTVTLGNGREVPALALAREIFARYGEGFMFQELLTNERRLAEAIGATVAGVRIVTVRTASGPKALYAAIRMPAPGAMSDATLGGRQVRAAIDVVTGRILRAQDMFRMSVTDLPAHPQTGAALPGLQLPHWSAAVEAVLAGHEVFADAGLLGWDVLLTDRGPVIAEANSNPLHELYQRCFGMGLLNPDLRPLIDAARDCAATRRAHRGPVVV